MTRVQETATVEIDAESLGMKKKEVVEQLEELLAESGIDATVTREDN